MIVLQGMSTDRPQPPLCAAYASTIPACTGPATERIGEIMYLEAFDARAFFISRRVEALPPVPLREIAARRAGARLSLAITRSDRSIVCLGPIRALACSSPRDA
jgi:hypothetical protein